MQHARPALEIGTSSVSTSDGVRLLSVLISADLSFDRHVTKVAGQCYYQLRQLLSVKEFLYDSIVSVFALRWSHVISIFSNNSNS